MQKATGTAQFYSSKYVTLLPHLDLYTLTVTTKLWRIHALNARDTVGKVASVIHAQVIFKYVNAFRYIFEKK